MKNTSQKSFHNIFSGHQVQYIYDHSQIKGKTINHRTYIKDCLKISCLEAETSKWYQRILLLVISSFSAISRNVWAITQTLKVLDLAGPMMCFKISDLNNIREGRTVFRPFLSNLYTFITGGFFMTNSQPLLSTFYSFRALKT